MMENTTVLATKRDFNRFTLVLKARCEAEGEVMVGLRDGTFSKVVFRPACEKDLSEDSFHSPGHGGYWEPSGHSVTSSRFDIVEMVGMPARAAGAACAWPGEVGPYSELNLSAAPRVVATVLRGHIMRYETRQSWMELLVALPFGTIAQDADAVTHYRKCADGRFAEYYGWEPSTVESPIYVSAESVLPDQELVAEARFRQACWLATRFAIGRYLMSNAHGRWDGAEKAHRHQELCQFYVAMARGVAPEDVRVDFEDDYKAVHDNTQKLTDHLDEVIGFPLESTPDYDVLEPMFFERFHVLALEVLKESALQN
jgi:hypothetical protein